MPSRRKFLKQSLFLSASGLFSYELASATSPSLQPNTPAIATMERHASLLPPQPPPDLFDAQLLDLEFWLKPRVLEVTRPASSEHAKLLYWKDGEIQESAYQQLCHLLRDVHGKQTAPIDPKLLETLWCTQAFIARYGMVQPLEILSGYRTAASNQALIETGVPAARKSLHLEGRAADIRIAKLDSEVLGGLVRSFRQGGVGFYYRQSSRGGWIHTDTGLQRIWKG